MADNIKNEEQEEELEIIELINKNGEHEFFIELCTLPYKNDWYVGLKACDSEGNCSDEDDVFFLKLDEDNEDDDQQLEVVTDENVLSYLFDEVMKS